MSGIHRIPDRGQIDRLRPWREIQRPTECAEQTPCWVTDPYGAISPTMHCAGCGAVPRFDIVLFEYWLKYKQSEGDTS